MIIYSTSITPRLQYVTGFIGKEIGNSAFRVTSSLEEYKGHAGLKINYSEERLQDDELWIRPHSLLFENNIRLQGIDCFEWNGKKAFFKTNGDLPFDLFAASFYLLSRYEEYLPHQKDIYGRYDHKNSTAFKNDFLHQPLVNDWLKELKKIIKNKFPAFNIHRSVFVINSTYDIDMGWSYLHKGWWRNAGGILRSFIKGDWRRIKERINVLKGKQKDPYDAYEWMDQLHKQFKFQVNYFFLVATDKGRYDKNISPLNNSMQQLISDHARRYSVGVHPSWHSGDQPSLAKDEINTLARIIGTPVLSSRQHYLRFTLPGTFRILIDNGIRFDYSMGYGHVNGFRASVCTPFYWYDLEKECQTELLLHPFCFMDANSFYEQRYTAEQTLKELRHYYQVVKAVDGVFIMIWHNSFLGMDAVFEGWRQLYKQFIQEISA